MGLSRDIRRFLRNELDERRYEHTLNVAKTARKLAKRHVCFGSKRARKQFLKSVTLAALLHDADKSKDPEALWKKISGEDRGLVEEFKAFPDLWHAYAAATTARQMFNLKDKTLLDALRYHTTGRESMSVLEKIIYLADYIEPGRDFPGVKDIRLAARQSLDYGCLKALEHSIAYLNERGAPVSPLTAAARKDLLNHGIF